MDSQNHHIGNYILGKTIGKGTFGKVKEAVHVPTGQKVAIKILSKDKIQDEQDKQRLLREMQILRKIRHPNIIQLYQIMQTNQQIYLVLQYAEKGELFRLITRQERLKQQSAGRLFLQLINAVEYLHRLKISHRDLKPQNILLDFDYNVKLIDFGLSNYYIKGQLLETACGSPCYAPPQMVSGKNYDGFGTDIWSMGIIFYVMVTGNLPFEDKTTKQLYQKIIQGKFIIPEFLSDQAKQIIQYMLVTDPLKRIALPQLRNLKFFDRIKPLQPLIYGLMVGVHPMPIDLELLQQLKQYIENVDTKMAQKDIRQNRHNSVTTTYYLLQKKILRDGGKTTIDLQIYLESNLSFPKQVQASPASSIPTAPIRSTTQRDATPDDAIKYQRTNRSLLKKKPVRKNRFVAKPLDLNENPVAVSLAKKFKCGEYTYLNKDYTKKFYRSNQKQQRRKYHSLTKAEQQFREMVKKRQTKKGSSITKENKKKIQERKTSQTKKINISTNSDEFKQKQTSRAKEKLKSQIRQDRDIQIPLATKVWNAYFKNSLSFKPKQQSKTHRINLKEKQKQQMFRQNLKQLKQGFTRLPQLKTQRKQSRQRSMQKLNTARK